MTAIHLNRAVKYRIKPLTDFEKTQIAMPKKTCYDIFNCRYLISWSIQAMAMYGRKRKGKI